MCDSDKTGEGMVRIAVCQTHIKTMQVLTDIAASTCIGITELL